MPICRYLEVNSLLWNSLLIIVRTPATKWLINKLTVGMHTHNQTVAHLFSLQQTIRPIKQN